VPSGSVPAPMPARSGRQAVVRPARHGPQAPHAGALVPEHHGPGPDPLALDDVQVGAADADGVDAHERIARTGPLEVDLPHDERDARRLEQRRAHPHRRGPYCVQSFAAMSVEGAISHSHVSA